jgi:simple sugar transport system substrate-binding protein
MKHLRLRALLALLFAFALVATACGDGGEVAAPGGEEEGTDTAAATPGADLTFHVITHGDGGVFWSVAQKGAEQAGADIGVNVIYQGANNDAEAQAQMIEAAIAAGTDGLAVSLANPEALRDAVGKAVEAGIPVYTLNSGLLHYRELGATTHVGQTEVIAGNGAGERLNELGATHVLCGTQEQGNVALEERCQGLAETFEGTVTTEFIGLDANPTEQENQISAILAANPDIDAVLGTGPNVPIRALAAAEAAGRELIVAGFDISVDVINAIEAGRMAFTVDQQQYLQGYLPVVFLYLEVTNLNQVGGGLPILTGPGFVTADNVGQVKDLVNAGTR